MAEESEKTESVDDFRERARAWLAVTVPKWASDTDGIIAEGGEAAHRRARKGQEFQAALYEGGFAGITFPKEYGGLALTPKHRDAFNQEVRGAGPAAIDLFNLMGSLWGLSIGMIAPTMLEFSTEEQKRLYIPEMLRGEKLWAQMLSEPTGGSDLAGAVTRATRDGDRFIINGSKVWTSQADFSQMAVLLARTNWDVPKHRGLSMFIIALDTPGLSIIPLRLAGGGTGFCQEFFDEMEVPADNVLGPVDDGWNVASRLLVHERNTVGGGSIYHTMFMGGSRSRGEAAGGTVQLARRAGVGGEADLMQQVVETHVLSTVSGHLAERVVQGMSTGQMPPAAGSILRLFGSMSGIRASDVTMNVAGMNGVAWPADQSAPGSAAGVGYLARQGGAMASGTGEIQRNIISERVLGLPREPAPDKDLPFKDVRINTMPSGDSRR